MGIKQVIIIRSDLKISRGKMISQCAHASLEAYKLASKTDVKKWETEGVKKVVLEIRDLKELLDLYKKAKKLKLPSSMIKDAGLTEIRPGTITCIGIGPAESSEIDKVTGKLKLLD